MNISVKYILPHLQHKSAGRKEQQRSQFYCDWHGMCRLLATAGSWFLWDFSFYGNKVFQSTFIQILSPGASLLTTLLWTLLNSGCALVGYYVSAALVDNPKVFATCCCLSNTFSILLQIPALVS